MNLGFAWAVNLIRNLDLAWMNCPLPIHSQSCTSRALRPVTIRISNVTKWTIDRPKTIRARSHDNASHGIVPWVSPIVVSWLVAILVGENTIELVWSADVSGSRLCRGCIVSNTKMQRFVAFGSSCDLVDVHHSQRRLNDQAKTDSLLSAYCSLNLACQRICHVDILGVADHGNYEHIATFPCLLDDVDHIPIHVMTVQAIDPDSHSLRSEIHFLQGFDDVLARDFLFACRHRILQIHHNDICG
mmetsp:Transcript_107579/g.169825  ORF Transcript_107579/g.169825 Transcript_107579/m.169825 type:complete len:244 (-) Transcript_107579:263-994(-)